MKRKSTAIDTMKELKDFSVTRTSSSFFDELCVILQPEESNLVS